MLTVTLRCSKHPRWSPAVQSDGSAKDGTKLHCAECRDLLDIYDVYLLHCKKYPPKPKGK